MYFFYDNIWKLAPKSVSLSRKVAPKSVMARQKVAPKSVMMYRRKILLTEV